MLQSQKLVLIHDYRVGCGIIEDEDWLWDGRPSRRGLLRNLPAAQKR